MDEINFIRERIEASVKLKSALFSNDAILNSLNQLVSEVVKCYNHGGKVLWCGNGGSAADAQHLAAELSGRFYYDRAPLFSDALHVNTSYLTAVGNDYGYEVVYSRLTQAMGKKGDILIGLSTSGNSPNVVNALIKAKEIGMITAGFTGESGGNMKPHCDFLIDIPSKDTPRIQECHMLLGHTLCEMVEMKMFPKK
jgi:D-sedoheptulose 7-phosphate isomerase